MGCLFAVVALLTPRFVMFILWIFTDYLSTAYGGYLWPLLGFFFLPTTTIAYAIAQNEFGGVRGGGLLILILGVALDLGLLGGSSSRGRDRRRKGRSPLT
jgi:hypothetical protein